MKYLKRRDYYRNVVGIRRCSITTPSQLDRGEKNIMGHDNDRERSIFNCCHEQNRLNIRKLVYYQSKKSKIRRSKAKSEEPLPPPPLSPQILLLSSSSTGV